MNIINNEFELARFNLSDDKVLTDIAFEIANSEETFIYKGKYIFVFHDDYPINFYRQIERLADKKPENFRIVRLEVKDLSQEFYARGYEGKFFSDGLNGKLFCSFTSIGDGFIPIIKKALIALYLQEVTEYLEYVDIKRTSLNQKEFEELLDSADLSTVSSLWPYRKTFNPYKGGHDHEIK